MLSGRFFVAGAALCPGVLSSLLLEGHACPNDSFKHYHLADVRVKVGYSVHLEHQSRGLILPVGGSHWVPLVVHLTPPLDEFTSNFKSRIADSSRNFSSPHYFVPF